MKRILTVIGLALAVGVIHCSAQQNTFSQQVAAFFDQNPTNLWELGGYGMADVTGLNSTNGSGQIGSVGGGIRLSYWINPSVGAALDANYIDGGLSYGVLSMAGRGTAKLGNFADVTFYAIGGPGYMLRGGNKTLIAMVGTGADVQFGFLKKWNVKVFGEVQHRTTQPTTDLAVFGAKKGF